MGERLKELTNKKWFHVIVLILIIVVILFTMAFILLRYSVEGETNMPFVLSKISIISSVEGIDKEAGENKWAFDINQNNDIYLYIEKNDNYGKTEVIDSIILDNFEVNKEKELGNIEIYRPDNTDLKAIFKNKEENITDKIEFIGDVNSNLKELRISNQGDLIAFRYANDNISEYISNDEEVNHSELLAKSNITLEDLKSSIDFDITIKLNSGKEYKGLVSLDMKLDNLIQEGTVSTEITDLKDVIFKRIKN